MSKEVRFGDVLRNPGTGSGRALIAIGFNNATYFPPHRSYYYFYLEGGTSVHESPGIGSGNWLEEDQWGVVSPVEDAR
jgi:hypothetical protein